jgi:hypothetical protein
MASEVQRHWPEDVVGTGEKYVLATDHDRVVAELRSHVRTDNSAVIAGLQEQMAEARELLRTLLMLHEDAVWVDEPWSATFAEVKTWLEKTK